MSEDLHISPFAEVLADFRAGKMVIIVDDADRENEGDLAIAAERVRSEDLAFMLREARGLICVSLSRERAKKLELPLQVENNNSPFNTPFTISVDHRDVVDTGVNTESRAKTIRRLASPDSIAQEFCSPGNVFPLIAHPAGVIGRQGQTEGSYDLARMAGFDASGVICEILNPDGTMARGKELNQFASQHGMKITSIEEIIRYRVSEEVLVREIFRSLQETEFGDFEVVTFQDDVDGKEHLALIYHESDTESEHRDPLVRVHSECLTGDVFGSERCDCSQQLHFSLREIAKERQGILLYLRQEGRGIGLANKLKAYELQDRGLDTVEANVELGFAPDERDFAVAAKILSSLAVNRVRLLTNNPDKVQTLSRFGISVAERVPVLVSPTEHSAAYLATKREKLGHLL